MCTITNTRKSELKPLVPMLECVLFRGSTPEQAVWGYRNDNAFAVLVPIGDANGFAPAPADRGQPKEFEPGRWTDSFQTPFGLHLDPCRPHRNRVEHLAALYGDHPAAQGRLRPPTTPASSTCS